MARATPAPNTVSHELKHEDEVKSAAEHIGLPNFRPPIRNLLKGPVAITRDPQNSLLLVFTSDVARAMENLHAGKGGAALVL
ncbi:uncharacterized protein TrAFT101_001675 [Trichoderma asperellum]|uniref:uncharacterized protein n=1 Tax=Trichoderma asperellum TaxID=101201 RepID=UPI00331B0C45|nr:hypothetical protein TrAFT101_001675 [Trichoderma asperellum]